MSIQSRQTGEYKYKQPCACRCGTGDGFYVVEEGEFTIYKADVSEEIAHAGPGSCFGERALLRSEPRAATVQAVTRWPLYTCDHLRGQ